MGAVEEAGKLDLKFPGGRLVLSGRRGPSLARGTELPLGWASGLLWMREYTDEQRKDGGSLFLVLTG